MNNSPNCKNDLVEEKKRLLCWLADWKEDCSLESNNFDIKEMSLILQLMGFRLEKNLEKVLPNENCSNAVDNNNLKIEVTCPKSGLRSILIKETTSCKCPSEEALEEGEFWSISGSMPSRRGSINSSNSSLLPTIPLAKSQLIRCLLAKILSDINEFETNDNEQNASSSMISTSLARHRSLDTLKTIEASTSALRGIKRRPSWEVDPKTSPPTQTSSPVPQLCHSLSQISLNSEKSNIVVKNLENIKKLVEETLDIAAGNNLTYTKNNVPTKRVSDIKPINSPNTSTKVLSTPRKVLTPKKKLFLLEKERLAIPSRIASLKKNTKTISPAKTSSETGKQTPSPNFIKKNILRSGESTTMVKSKIALKHGGSVREVPSSSGIRKSQVAKKALGGSSTTLSQKRS